MNRLKQLPKVIPHFHLWVVVILFIIGIILHYPQQMLSWNSPSLFSFLGLTRHAAERIFLLLPIGYAGFFLGTRAGLVSLAAAAVIMFPRVFLVSAYFPDALFETVGIIFIGGMMDLWLTSYRNEEKRQRQMLSNLEKAQEQLQSRTMAIENVAVENARLYQQQTEIAEKLRMSEQRYRELFESAPDAIWVHDMDGNLITVNEATEKLSGYNLQELSGMNVRNFLTEDSLRLAGQIRRKLIEGGIVDEPYEQRIIRKDGSEWILMLTTNLIKEDGKQIGFLCIARDVTKEKEMQGQLSKAYQELTESHQKLKDSQQQLIQAEKLTSLGQLAASIAHEVNNPLSGVLVYTQLIAKKLRGGGIENNVALDYLTKMESELTRSTKLIRNLLDFARQSSPKFQQVNLNTLMNLAYDLASHTAELQHVTVTKEFDSSLPDITADADQLQQVFTNLILNAIQAMPQGGKLVLRSSVDKDQVKIEVRDTGYGIPPENMNKLFTPFFTTKSEVKGVGLGLAISYGIIQRHKGKIEVQSKVGEGTTFTIYLPLHSELAET